MPYIPGEQSRPFPQIAPITGQSHQPTNPNPRKSALPSDIHNPMLKKISINNWEVSAEDVIRQMGAS